MIKQFVQSLFLGLLLTGTAINTSVAQKTSGGILLRNATIIDGRSHIKPYQGSILIEDGLIKKITKQHISVDQDVHQLDCTGKYIVPGLFEAHMHLATGDLSDRNKAKASTDRILLNMVHHGITTVRDMAGDAPYLFDYKRKIDKGELLGPDIFYAAQFAGPDYFEMFSRGSRVKMGNKAWERAITDTTDIEKVVKEAKAAGVTAIKTYAQLSKETMLKIVKSARKEGLLVWSHATVFPIQPTDAVELSVNSISHAADVIFEQIPRDSLTLSYAWSQVYKGLKVDPKTLNPLFVLMKKNKVYFDPTIFHATNNKLYYAVEIAKLAHQSGVKIVCGTDWIYPEDTSMVPLYDEARIYKEDVGMSALEVLESLTYNAALVTGLKDRGCLMKGLRADLLLLDKNPMEDIKALFQPQMVFLKGNIVK
ncbi:Imidazolonepropionase [Sphingobacterium nematocida]|uniref:Imidazolonepropionase n=1 Tax=Sphingobacterium nematocida TaxID=1513896 RepID=A0A1T5CRE5_9SPHI|nr:amidohydrolase family protein [Sphingobacterium nematocida]SKB61997.1 Imidazolonepropionase [Sphingobacterium nematocida]